MDLKEKYREFCQTRPNSPERNQFIDSLTDGERKDFIRFLANAPEPEPPEPTAEEKRKYENFQSDPVNMTFDEYKMSSKSELVYDYYRKKEIFEKKNPEKAGEYQDRMENEAEAREKILRIKDEDKRRNMIARNLHLFS